MAEYRKIQSVGTTKRQSYGIVIPKQIAMNIGIAKGEFVKVYQEGQRIIIEKV